MNNIQGQAYYKGYIAGYTDGIRDVTCGKTAKATEVSLTSLPVNAMALSARAYDCLTRSGCESIADVVALSKSTIASMRNLG